ncbi:MAG: hypothetical protein VKL39_24425, partial [Leptolyngbyaceae bacterium]|nr:hypothetical protein [Leptolyngbyaceae bacterium]
MATIARMANRQAQQRLLQDTGVRPGSTPAVGARTLLHTDLPAFTWYQARRMLREPAVRPALDYMKGPIHQMTVEIGPPDPMAPPKPGPKLRVIAPHPIVATYLAKNLDILWDQELAKLLRCIEDGVSFAAVEYERRGGSVYV